MLFCICAGAKRPDAICFTDRRFAKRISIIKWKYLSLHCIAICNESLDTANCIEWRTLAIFLQCLLHYRIKRNTSTKSLGGRLRSTFIDANCRRKKFLEKDRQSWFSHKAEVAAPDYYKVYLADPNVTAELAPSERGCIMRFTFPETNQANVVIDAFDQGSFVKIIPEENKIIGYTTQHSGGKTLLPKNFKNYFVVKFDKPFNSFSAWRDSSFVGEEKEVEGKRTGVVVTFSTLNGEKVIARVASSFISPEQAELNLSRELGKKSFDEVREEGKQKWEEYLSKFLIEDDKLNDLDNVRMFYTCLYRMLLYPREFF